MSGITPILLDAKASATFLGVSLRTFRDLRKEPGFPLPVSLGPRTHRWRRSDLETWVASLQAAVLDEPAQLEAARVATQAARRAR